MSSDGVVISSMYKVTDEEKLKQVESEIGELLEDAEWYAVSDLWVVVVVVFARQSLRLSFGCTESLCGSLRYCRVWFNRPLVISVDVVGAGSLFTTQILGRRRVRGVRSVIGASISWRTKVGEAAGGNGRGACGGD